VTVAPHEIPLEKTGTWVVVLRGVTAVDDELIEAEGATITLTFLVQDPCDTATVPAMTSRHVTHYVGNDVS